MEPQHRTAPDSPRAHAKWFPATTCFTGPSFSSPIGATSLGADAPDDANASELLLDSITDAWLLDETGKLKPEYAPQATAEAPKP